MNSDYIEVHISGKRGSEQLRPDNYDISELQETIELVKRLLPREKNDNESVVSLEIKDGSVRQIYKTTRQRVAVAATIIGMVIGNTYLENIDKPTAEIFEKFQNFAKGSGLTYDISTSIKKDEKLSISPTTNYKRHAIQWVDGEFYLYGSIYLAGGKNNSKIYINTKDYGTLGINIDKSYISSLDENMLYKDCGIVALGKQDANTYELDGNSLTFVKFIRNYKPSLDLDYLDHCIERATEQWGGIDSYNEWLAYTRG